MFLYPSLSEGSVCVAPQEGWRVGVCSPPSGHTLLACVNMSFALQKWGKVVAHPKSCPEGFQAKVLLGPTSSGVLAMACIWDPTTVIVPFQLYTQKQHVGIVK